MTHDGAPIDPLDLQLDVDQFTTADLDEVEQVLAVLEYPDPPHRDEVAIQALRRLAAHIRALP